MALRCWTARQSESGAELLELALVTPMFLVLTAGIVDFGFVFQQYNVVTNAAREGARLAAVPNTRADAVANRVNAYAQAGGLTRTPTTTVAPVNIATHPGGPVYNGVRVTVTYPCQFFVLGRLSSMIGATLGAPMLTAQATMRHESQ
jgi:Flp pilus assembly protein TadG